MYSKYGVPGPTWTPKYAKLGHQISDPGSHVARRVVERRVVRRVVGRVVRHVYESTSTSDKTYLA